MKIFPETDQHVLKKEIVLWISTFKEIIVL